jgi:phenylacetate-CoA ligase
VRIENVNKQVGTNTWENNFKKMFKEICTVRIDAIEYVEAGTITHDLKAIVDVRKW